MLTQSRKASREQIVSPRFTRGRYLTSGANTLEAGLPLVMLAVEGSDVPSSTEAGSTRINRDRIIHAMGELAGLFGGDRDLTPHQIDVIK